jgi:hypothetical protein
LVLSQAADDNSPVPDFQDALHLLGRCRHVSRQALLSDSMLAVEGRAGPLEVHPVPAVVFPDAEGGLPARVTRRAVDGALTVEHLRVAVRLGRDFVAPIHDSLLLDAICAWLSADYRKAILYAAIAVESLANLKLEEALDAATTGSAPGLRFVTIPGSGGGTRKDPVYEALSQGVSFTRLLHERSLYLLNRSLMVDDPVLFSLALRLYGTRNKIAHRGEPSGQQSDILPVDLDGGRQALDCAIRVFAWYGEGQGYSLPSHETASGVFVRDYAPAQAPTGPPINLGTMVLNTQLVEVMASLSEAAARELLAAQGVVLPEPE